VIASWVKWVCEREVVLGGGGRVECVGAVLVRGSWVRWW